MRRRAAVVEVPGSKSVAIRALLIGAMARGRTRIENSPRSDDVMAVMDALRALGIPVSRGRIVTVEGCGGTLPPGPRRLWLGGSATGLRMMACLVAGRDGRTVLDAEGGLLRRPMDALVAALPACGARSVIARPGLPIAIEGGGRRRRGAFVVDASGTSQVASGVLLAGGRVRIRGRSVSRPYLEMTRRMIREFRGRGRRVRVPADWSSAAYPLAAAAILGRPVRVPGLKADSLQADEAVLGLLRKAGARCGVDRAGAWGEGSGGIRPFRVDLRDAPDLAPVAAALALFAPGESRVTGAAHLRGKESDRIAASVAAVRALGGKARATRDGFVVRGGTPRAGVVEAAGDHRIALAFSVAAAAIPGAKVRGRGCVSKSWPGALRAMRPALRPSA